MSTNIDDTIESLAFYRRRLEEEESRHEAAIDEMGLRLDNQRDEVAQLRLVRDRLARELAVARTEIEVLRSVADTAREVHWMVEGTSLEAAMTEAEKSGLTRLGEALFEHQWLKTKGAA